MKQLQVTQIDNGWMVAYNTVATVNGKPEVTPHGIYCKGPAEVSQVVQRICIDMESDNGDTAKVQEQAQPTIVRE